MVSLVYKPTNITAGPRGLNILIEPTMTVTPRQVTRIRCLLRCQEALGEVLRKAQLFGQLRQLHLRHRRSIPVSAGRALKPGDF